MKPGAVTDESEVKSTYIDMDEEVTLGGAEEPEIEFGLSRIAELVGPSYTFTKSYPASVSNWVNTREMGPLEDWINQEQDIPLP